MCFGIAQANTNVCSSNGNCFATNYCTCFPGWTGSDCSTRIQGFVYTCGYATNGQLGDPVSQKTSLYRIQSWYSFQSINQVSAGRGYSLTLSSAGAVHSFGLNTYGTLGTGDTTSYSTPQTVTKGEIGNRTMALIAACSFHSMAVDSNGVLFTVCLI